MALRGNLFAFSRPFRGNPSPFLGEPLLSPLQRLSGPSPFFVALRGYLFSFGALSLVEIVSLANLGRPLSSPRQPLSGPLPSFVALRGNLFAFSRPSWTPWWRTLGGPLSSPLQRLSGPLPSFVALRGNLFFSFGPFVDLRFLGEPLSSPLQRLSGPLPSFVALRGNLFAFSRPSWTRLVEILSPLGEPWRTPLEPPPTP